MHSTAVGWLSTLCCAIALVLCGGTTMTAKDQRRGAPPTRAPRPTPRQEDAALPPRPAVRGAVRPAPAEPLEDATAEPDASTDNASGDAADSDLPDGPDGDLTKPGPDDAGDAAPPDDDDAEEPPAPDPAGTSLLDKIRKATADFAPPQPAEFHGVRPGRTKIAEVQKTWGTPLDVLKQKDVVRQTYRVEDFGRVEVRSYRDTVQSVIVHCHEKPALSDLAEKLGLAEIESVDVTDEFGEALGAAFPEAGVMVAFEPGSRDRKAAQAIFEPIDAQAFLLRAEQRLANDYTGCHRDLDIALSIDPQLGRAYWLRSRVLTAIGQVDAATKAAEEALRLEPKNAEYRLTRASLLAERGQFAAAIGETKEAIALAALQPELKALGLAQLGDHLAAAPDRDYKQALQLHTQAIKLAEPLLQDRRVAVRHMAQQAAVAAHLAAAHDIAWGHWKMKSKIVPQWLARAEELADQVAATDTTANYGMRLCREAIGACVGMEGDLDPTPWVEKALAVGEPILAAAKDDLRRQQLQWELGALLYDALQVYHVADDAEKALKYGTLAVEHMEAGAKDRQLEPVEAYMLGRLYFRVGSVYALHEKQPTTAVVWFERAIPLLERPVPVAALSDGGRQGESFVSMAVTYWTVGSHEESMRLTRQGVKLMERAVKDGILEEAALKVPYTNLMTMHRFLGDDEQAEAFANLAARAGGARRK
ncbi:MAG: hypothetical protein HYX69_07760 [Planctomycetia bacterium]|nr:hypothetical protein [Planctomycetia bacterium]